MAEHFNPFSPRMKPRRTKDDYKKAPEPMGDAMSPRVTPFEYRFYERTEEYSHPNVVNTPEGPPPEPPEAWRRRHYNWRLAAQLLADGVAYWDVANRIGCRHNHFLRAMRESARFNRYIVEETQLRREAQERRLEMLGERLPHWIRNLEDNPRLVAMVFKRLMGTRPGELTKARRERLEQLETLARRKRGEDIGPAEAVALDRIARGLGARYRTALAVRSTLRWVASGEMHMAGAAVEEGAGAEAAPAADAAPASPRRKPRTPRPRFAPSAEAPLPQAAVPEPAMQAAPVVEPVPSAPPPVPAMPVEPAPSALSGEVLPAEAPGAAPAEEDWIKSLADPVLSIPGVREFCAKALRPGEESVLWGNGKDYDVVDREMDAVEEWEALQEEKERQEAANSEEQRKIAGNNDE